MKHQSLCCAVLYTVICCLNYQIKTEKVDKEEKYGVIDGEVTIGGLVPVYQPVKYGNCSSDFGGGFGIQRLEALVYAVNKINNDPSFRPVNLGLEVRDSCNLESQALEQSLSFVVDKVPDVCGRNNSKNDKKAGKLVGVAGATLSQVTGQVAKLLRLFKIPQISYASTSDALNDDTTYSFLLRTVPSDKFQANAIIDFIANELKWTSIYGLYGEGSYGENGMKALTEAAEKKNICVVATRKISANTHSDAIQNILKSFAKERNVPGVVLFCHMLIIEHILNAAAAVKLDNHFSWIGSDGWGLHTDVQNIATNNAIVFSLHYHDERLGGFKSYYKSLKPKKENPSNPWFYAFWMQSCKKRSREPESDCKIESSEFDFCNDEKVCFNDDKVPYVIDTVYAFAYALKSLYKEKCNNNLTCLTKLKIETQSFFDNYLKTTEFNGTSGHISFKKDYLKGVYDISQLYNGKFRLVGEWKSGKLIMNKIWKKDNLIQSACGKNCSYNEVRRLRNNNKCCWSCVKCKSSQYVISLNRCQDCKKGEIANKYSDGCEKLPIIHWKIGWRVAVSFLASVGCCMTVFVVVVFIRYCNTPVIMAASREISFTLLFGILISYSLTFVMASWPEPITCGVVRFGTGFSSCICYAALLVKTSRIARIFSGQVDPLFITPKWQLVLTGLLVMPQALIGVVGLLVNPPKKTYSYESLKFTLIQCNSSTNDLIVSISYNLLLIFLCTIYAFRTRKVPENFNEARFIGFVMYTTCAIWLAFLPLFYGASVGYRNVALSLNLILNATTILIGLFGMKIYIVLLRPEKNIRANSKMRSFSHLTTSNEDDNVRNHQSQTELNEDRESKNGKKQKKKGKSNNETLVSYVSDGPFITFTSNGDLSTPDPPKPTT